MWGRAAHSPGGGVRGWRPRRSTIPARACGTIRTPAAAVMNTNSARTIRTIKPAVMRSPLLADERRGAPYLENVDPGAGLDDLVVVEGPGGPDLAVELHAADALVVGD